MTYGLPENAQTTGAELYPEESEIATLFEKFIKEKNLSELAQYCERMA